MLKFLLDEQISPKVVAAIERLTAEIPVEAVTMWQDGIYRAQPDHLLLEAATDAGFTLVTFDVSTIPPLLRQWAEQERSHQGVVFIDEHSIASNDFGAISRALVRLHELAASDDWTNRVVFLSDTCS